MFWVKQTLDKISRFGLVLKNVFFCCCGKQTSNDESKELTPLLSTADRGRFNLNGAQLFLFRAKKGIGI